MFTVISWNICASVYRVADNRRDERTRCSTTTGTTWLHLTNYKDHGKYTDALSHTLQIVNNLINLDLDKAIECENKSSDDDLTRSLHNVIRYHGTLCMHVNARVVYHSVMTTITVSENACAFKLLPEPEQRTKKSTVLSDQVNNSTDKKQ